MNAPFLSERRPQAGLTVHRLKPHHCRWIVCDEPFLFCGEPKAVKSYCEEHAKRVYTIPPKAR